MNSVRSMLSLFLAVMVSVTFLAGALPADARQPKEPKTAKHIILFIGDGMQLEHEVATSRYLYGNNYRLSFHNLPYRTNVTTWDVTTYNKYAPSVPAPVYNPAYVLPATGYDMDKGGAAPYPLQTTGLDEAYLKFAATDSASAATAIATGYKTDDGNLAWLSGDPADGALKTIAEQLREEKGYSIGLVTTVPFTHATPAGFVSHNVSRNNYHAIGAEIIHQVEPEVVIGGGFPFGGAHGYISEGDYAFLKSPANTEYLYVERTSGVDGGTAILDGAKDAISQGKKLFGLFGGNGGNFESPVPSDTPGSPRIVRGSLENPLLKDATVAALKVVSQDKDGFFLMIEQGDIDWANHANDYARMIGTTWDLHEAVKAAVAFVNKPKDDITWDNTLLIVSSDHSNSYLRISDDVVKGDLPYQIAKPGDFVCPSGSYCGSFLYPDGDVYYGSGSHTNEPVRLYAYGKGHQLFRKYEGDWYPCTKLIDNTHIYHVMAEAAGIPQESPLDVFVEMPDSCNDYACVNSN